MLVGFKAIIKTIMAKNFRRKIRYSLEVVAHIFGRSGIEKYCLYCDFQGRFDTLGHSPRYGSLCPFCGSLERQRLLALVDRKEDFFTGKEVLHFAPEFVVTRLIRTRASAD
jgi:hypothetical protein